MTLVRGGVTVGVVLLCRATAPAHSFEPAVLDLREREAGLFDVVWKPPARRLDAEQLEANALTPSFPPACTVSGATVDEMDADGSATMVLDCRPAGLRGQTITIPGLAGTRLDAMVRLTWSDGTVSAGICRADAPGFLVPGVGAGVPAAQVLWRYGRLGVEHILGGSDHLLFVLGLMLLVRRLRPLALTITAFTVAHSLALGAAVLDVVRASPAPVEVVIALSIVLLAAELARPPDAPPTLTQRAPWLVAFAFGLLHGLGFAGALAEVGLPSDQLPLSLLAFNLGVEVGQVAFVAALLLPLLYWRRWADRAVVRLAPAYAIGTLAVVWALERASHLIR
ncbi:MAG: HupE/UreJ family protein [Candidatus Binatia bacterium]